MDILLISLAIIFGLLSLAGAVVPVIPSGVFAYFSLWLARWSGYADFSDGFMWITAGVTLVVILCDYILPPLITRKMGGTKYASYGAMIGMLIGIFFTPIGMLLGMVLGAFIGELIFAKKSHAQSFVAAFGAFLGFLVGTGLKLILAGYFLFQIIAALL